MLKYCKSLKFEEDPNYAYMKELLKDVFTRNKYEYDFDFDWNTRSQFLEKKTTFSHLMERQLQFTKKTSAKKLAVVNEEEK